ncbi:DUF7127 family protein [Halovenus marina]|uniref:DUF7127 family protein n=1 Tax=Halovenus marina TaxID=3396621 RepID=UPI003F5477B8
MTVTERFAERGIDARRIERDDGVELIADLGPETDASAEIVDGTVIVVTDDDQYDIDLDADGRALINNGILTVEVNE